MRRSFALVPLLLAACSSEAPPAKVEEAAADSLSPGQWEVTKEVTSLTKMDEGAPAIAAKAGDKTSFAVCVAEAEKAKPPTDLLSGREGLPCTSESLYLSGGRVNASLSCAPKGLRGKLYISSSGTFKADSLELAVSGSTQLSGTGDVKLEEKVTARRTGAACTTPAAKS